MHVEEAEQGIALTRCSTRSTLSSASSFVTAMEALVLPCSARMSTEQCLEAEEHGVDLSRIRSAGIDHSMIQPAEADTMCTYVNISGQGIPLLAFQDVHKDHSRTLASWCIHSVVYHASHEPASAQRPTICGTILSYHSYLYIW